MRAYERRAPKIRPVRSAANLANFSGSGLQQAPILWP